MKVIDNVSRSRWGEIARECGYATFFHTYEWAKVIEDTFGHYEIATKLFIFPDRTEALFPLMSSKVGLKGFFKSYHSMVPGVYGNLISSGELSLDKIEQIFRGMARANVAHLGVVGNPFADYAMPDYFETKPLFTQVLHLGDGFEALWRIFSKGHRSSVKKARKMGVSITIGGSLEDYREYFTVYRDSVRRWGERATSTYPFTLFENICNLRSPNVRLWLAKLDGKIISGALVFYHNKHGVWWHGATLGDYFEYCPANLLQADIINDACNRHYEAYDFNPSGGHEGVVKFKKSFGARTVDFGFYELGDSAVYRAYRKLRGA